MGLGGVCRRLEGGGGLGSGEDAPRPGEPGEPHAAGDPVRSVLPPGRGGDLKGVNNAPVSFSFQGQRSGGSDTRLLV